MRSSQVSSSLLPSPDEQSIRTGHYRGRFAPSPTGPLHAGSLVAALASWLDARASNGTWIVRMEDVDTPRCIPGADEIILKQLAVCGLVSDEPVLYQSTRGNDYQKALDRLIAKDLAYPCGCSRKDIETVLAERHIVTPRNTEAVYPDTCRDGLHGKPARAWRIRLPHDASASIRWNDRRLGEQSQDVVERVGDFVIKRADGLWAYQLAVVVDDEFQRITHVVRGADLTDNTARQIELQKLLGYETPRYLHTPLVVGDNGEKLSKQNGAGALSLSTPAEVMTCMRDAAGVLGLSAVESSQVNDIPLHDALTRWVAQWRALYNCSHT